MEEEVGEKKPLLRNKIKVCLQLCSKYINYLIEFPDLPPELFSNPGSILAIKEEKDERLHLRILPINFNREPTERKEEIYFSLSKSKEEIDPLGRIQELGYLDLLNNQFNKIRAILNIGEFNNSPVFIGKHFGTGEKAAAYTALTSNGWRLWTRISTILKLDLHYMISRKDEIKRRIPLENPFPIFRSIVVVMLIHSIAHELYHFRQLKYFPISTNRFLDIDRFPDSNLSKLLRKRNNLGAELFSLKYIRYLYKHLDEADNSLLATSLRDFRRYEQLLESKQEKPDYTWIM